MNEKELRAIIYTDGSAIPNPGKAGAGIHGYIYDYKNNDNITINKPSRFIVTNNGYKDLDSAINSIRAAITFKEIAANKPQGFSFIVNPVEYIEGIVSLSNATNNVAELLGALEAVKFIVNNKDDYDIKHITIYTDSGYAINAFNKIYDSIGEKYNYWLNRPNHTQLREIESVLKVAIANNIKVELRWIKGHAGSIGNVKADMMADIGRKLPTDDVSVKIDFYNPKEYYAKLPINSYISDNMDKIVNDRNLNSKSLGYNFGFKRKLDKTVAGKGLKHNSYVMVKNIDDNSKLKFKNLTEEANKICTELTELAYNKHFKFISTGNKKENLTTILNLEELIKGDSYPYLNRYGAESSVELIKNRMDLSRVKIKITGDVEHHNTIADVYYSPEIDDELSRYNVVQYTTVEPFVDMLMQIHSGSYGFNELVKIGATQEAIDITESIYKNNKLILKDEKLQIENDDLMVNLITGINIPDLNLLKKYEKKIEDVKLNIMSNGRVFIVLYLEDAVIVYFNPMTVAYYKTEVIAIGTIDATVHKKKKKKKKR